MEKANRIKTLDELINLGTGKYYFESNHREVTIDESFAKEFCRRNQMRRNGDFLIHIDNEGQYYVIFLYEWKCETQHFSWNDKGFQVIKVHN